MEVCWNGGTMGYPQIIQFNRRVHNKPSIWGTPFDGKPPYGIKWHWLYHVKTSSAHPHHAGALPAVLVTLCFLPMKDGVALEQTFLEQIGPRGYGSCVESNPRPQDIYPIEVYYWIYHITPNKLDGFSTKHEKKASVVPLGLLTCFDPSTSDEKKHPVAQTGAPKLQSTWRTMRL